MIKFFSYQDTNTSWIGEIPTGWSLKSLKHIFTEKKSTKNPSLGCGSISFGKVIYKDDEKIPESTKESYQEVLDGEFLINPLNLNYDLKSLRIGLSRINVVVSQGYIVLNIKDGFFPEYYEYLLRKFDVEHMKSLGQGVRQTISYTHLKDEKLVVPPIEEQIRISSYLDKKTSQIDSLVNKIEKKIELLKEQRISLINQYVSKGIKPNVEMKDSGVEWIGEIPQHWEIKKIKYLGSIKSGEGITSSELKEDGEYPVYGGNGIVGFYTKFNLDQKAIIIGRVGEKCGNIHLVNSRSWVSDNSLILNLSSGENFEWVSLCLETRDLNKLRNQSSQPLITGTQVKNENIPYPPSNEMKDISEYIQKKSSNIDTDIQKSFKKIELLKEYRQSLISFIVTGKVRVMEEKV